MAAVKLNGKAGFINTKGKEVIPFVYDDADSFSEGLAPVKNNELWGFINKKNELVIPYKYEGTEGFFDWCSQSDS